MADAVLITIAEAIKDRLAGQSFSQTITPTRTYTPDFELDELSTATVYVIPGTDRKRRSTRGGWERECTCQIAIAKRLAPGSTTGLIANATIDPWAYLAEEIANNLAALTELPTYTAGKILGVDHKAMGDEDDAPLVPELLLRDRHLFLSIITVTVRVL